MPEFTAIIKKYANQGEKTGWTYIDIPKDVILSLNLSSKKAFRIKGLMDDVTFEKLSTYPIGNGEFVIALNATLRKQLGKKEGAQLKIKFNLDSSAPLVSKELLSCLKDDVISQIQFNSLLLSHQSYFHRYVESAKTQTTKAKRIAQTLNAMQLKQDYGTMIRSLKKET